MSNFLLSQLACPHPPLPNPLYRLFRRKITKSPKSHIWIHFKTETLKCKNKSFFNLRTRKHFNHQVAVSLPWLSIEEVHAKKCAFLDPGELYSWSADEDRCRLLLEWCTFKTTCGSDQTTLIDIAHTFINSMGFFLTLLSIFITKFQSSPWHVTMGASLFESKLYR